MTYTPTPAMTVRTVTSVAIAILRVSAPDAEVSDLADRDLAEARAALDALADTLDTCITCGKRHTLRAITGGQTWADPSDGHTYRRTINGLRFHGYTIVDWLRAEQVTVDE